MVENYRDIAREQNRITRTLIDPEGNRGETMVWVGLPSVANRYTATEGPLSEFDSRPLLDPTVPDHVVIGGPHFDGARIGVLIGEDHKGKVLLPGEEIVVHVPRRDVPPRGYLSDTPRTENGTNRAAYRAALEALGKDAAL